MKQSNRICIITFIITIILSVVSAIFLPDTVRVMHSAVTDTTTTLPKVWAILLAAILSVVGAVGVLISKKEEPAKYNILIISVIGIGWFVYMLIVNCVLKLGIL